ncbi:MAG: Holliday junction resolvase RecU [Longicatena sp.]
MHVIGYPNKKQKQKKPSSPLDNHMGRGMELEHDLNVSNLFYRENNRALIHKKPTPIQVVKVDYPARNAAKIVEAYYKTPSTTDYNGIYRGRAIDFEAKETRAKTSFPFKSIHPHQIEHLKKVLYHGGIGFFIIRFTSFDETYLIDAPIIIELYDSLEHQSISYKKTKEVGSLIQQGLTPRLRYLDNVDKLYFQEKNK